ncbi:MAG: DUF1361 domain-containing protein, partial [Bacteroidota bacterium]
VKSDPSSGYYSLSITMGILVIAMIFSSILRKWFYDRRQLFAFLILGFGSLFCIGLIMLRLHYAERPAFFFLIWNLFLAWIPFLIAISIQWIHDRFNWKYLTLFFLGVWLLFFPNAPYIVTDLIHLKARQPLPLWFDALMLVSFAWTGLMLGFVSLYEVQKFITKQVNARWGWASTVAAIGLGSFGIYLGRFERWNSWEIFYKPHKMFVEMVQLATTPKAIAVTVLFTGFLLLGYLSIRVLAGERQA